jgi:hypothetical protein
LKSTETTTARSLCPQLYDQLLDFSYLDADDTGGDFKKTGATPGQHDDAVISLCLALAFFRPGGEVVGRAFVRGIDRLPEPEVEQPKVEQAPAPEVVDGEDPEFARLRALAAAAAARRAKEQRELVRRITGKHRAHGTDGEPRGGWTGTPRRGLGHFGMWIDPNMGG